MNPPTRPTTSIDDLPPELIRDLFEYLHPKDLVVCSMVNRRWRSIYSGFKVHRLVTIDYRYEYALIEWYDSNQIIEENQRCHPALFDRLAKKPLLSNLKHLAICSYKSKFDLDSLKKFRQLVHLEIEIDLSKNVNLNLPKLEVLVFHYQVGSLSIVPS